MVKIALLSNINMDLLVPKLKKLLSDEGIDNDFYISGFNQHIQETINPDSVFNKKQFDIAILFLDGEEIFKEVIVDPFRYKEKELNNLVNREINNLRLQLESVLDLNNKLIFFVNNIFIRKPTISGLSEYNSKISISSLQEIFNKRLKEFNFSKRLIVIDFVSLVSRYGYETLYDNRLWYLGRIKFGERGFQVLSNLCLLYIQAYFGKSKKVLILDLDNTIWGGIIGEDGVKGIKIGEEGIDRAYRDFQRLIKSLTNRGILLAICSKNNLADVKDVFEKNEFMVLKEDDFVATKINWENKTENIKEISTVLNLGFDSFVFIDDNPFEREMVKKELPQVVVPEFPKDPADLSQWFIDLSFAHFNNVIITNEDRQRTEIYQADTKRKEMVENATTIEDFYSSLEMKAKVKIDNKEDIKRIAQLTQRTNQFNLTTRRYTENEILDLMNRQDWMVLTLDLNDRFGPNGIVSILIIKADKGISYIDTFLLSCRVIGRTIEHAFIWFLIETLREMGVEKLISEYIPTKKNMLVKDLYKNCGFHAIKVSSDQSTLWEYDLSKKQLKKNKWINVMRITKTIQRKVKFGA